jgi:hypothetical protein
MKNVKSAIPAFLAVFATIILVWYGNREVEPLQATWDDVVQEAQTGGYSLITTEELAELYSDTSSDLLLVDTRQEWEHRTGHIAGSINFSMEPSWWSRLTNAGDLLEALGPDKDRTIVFY